MSDGSKPDICPDNSILPLEWNSIRFAPAWAMTLEDVPEWDVARGGMNHVTQEEREHLFAWGERASAWAQWRLQHPDVVIPEARLELCPRLVDTGSDHFSESGLSRMLTRTMSYNRETQEKTFTFADVDTRDLIPALSRIWNYQTTGFPKKAEKGILELARNFSPHATVADGENGLTRDTWLFFAQRVQAVLNILECLQLEQSPDEVLKFSREKRQGDMIGTDRVRPQQAWYELTQRLELVGVEKSTPSRIKSLLIDYCIYCAHGSSVTLSSENGIPRLSVVSGTGQWALYLLARHVQRHQGLNVSKCDACGTLTTSFARGHPKRWCSDACEIRNRRKNNASKIATTVPQLEPYTAKSKPVKS